MSKQNAPFMREIKSFVKREGRLTPGQKNALEQYWPVYGKSIQDGPITIADNTVLEIGFGNGKSLLAMAKAAPDTHFIGIEVHKPGVGALLNGIVEQNVKNLQVYQEDAVEVLRSCIPDNSLQRVQLYFPDPWPKKKHHKRRIVQAEFVELVRQKLVDGGIFHMATDWQNYAESMLEVMQAAPGFSNMSATDTYSPKPTYRPTTKFEVRGQKLGHGVWDLLYRKTC